MVGVLGTVKTNGDWRQLVIWLKLIVLTSLIIFCFILINLFSVLSSTQHRLGLRLEHFHCFNQDQTNCGHCHFDTHGPTVAYRAYFSLAEKLIRIDQPNKGC
ncbi:unnamed protein product [Trichobilharzia regenti]|nr:unnamed protein product [Trichobilharzia regenti]